MESLSRLSETYYTSPSNWPDARLPNCCNSFRNISITRATHVISTANTVRVKGGWSGECWYCGKIFTRRPFRIDPVSVTSGGHMLIQDGFSLVSTTTTTWLLNYCDNNNNRNNNNIDINIMPRWRMFTAKDPRRDRQVPVVKTTVGVIVTTFIWVRFGVGCTRVCR